MPDMDLEQALAIVVGEGFGSEADNVIFTAASGLARIWRDHVAGSPPSPATDISDSLLELLAGLGLEADRGPEPPPVEPRLVSTSELRRLRRAQRAVDDARRALLELGVTAPGQLGDAEAAIPATVTVEVPCLICHRPSLVVVDVVVELGAVPEPPWVLCADCDSFVASEAEAQRRQAGTW